MSTISRDEWLQALGEAVKPVDPDALTIQEIAAQFQIGRQSAYLQMTRLVEAGRARKTWKMVACGNGRRRTVAYKLVTDAPRLATRRR
jgi:hypothetical protein